MANNNRITKAWIDANDAIIQQKLIPLSDGKVVIALAQAPQNWTSLLTYTSGSSTLNFKVGDEVRVPDNSSDTGYSYYKLYNISNGEATWAKGSSNSPSFKATVIVTLEAYANNIKTSGSDLTGAVVTLTNSTTSQSTTKTLAAGDTSVTFTDVEPLVSYTVSVSSTGNYAAPEAQTLNNVSLGATMYLTFGYFADEYTFNITSNQTNDTVIGAVVGTVSYTGGSQTSYTAVKVPEGTEVTVTFPDVTGYKKTVTNVGKAYTVTYQTEIVYVTLTTETDADISEATFIIKDGSDNTLGTGESGDSVKIPYDTTYTVSVSVLSGYQAEEASYTASQATRNVTLEYVELIKGVYAYYSDGSLRTIENADSSATGVAIIDDTCSFVITKNQVTSRAFGGYNKDLSISEVASATSGATAKQDLLGENNSTRIINACVDYTVDGITGAPAATWCRRESGYLPSLGELWIAYSHKTEVDAMMAAIGGTAMSTDDYFWSSTAYSATQSWRISWLNGSVAYGSRNEGRNVRAFAPIRIPITITATSSDNTLTYNSRYFFTLEEKSFHSSKISLDENGQGSKTYALGDVRVSVSAGLSLGPKRPYITTPKSFTVEFDTRSITVDVCTPNVGVFAYYADGSMKSYDDADSNAIGVAVVTSDHNFVIDKTFEYYGKFGTYGYSISTEVGCSVNETAARQDYGGEYNTWKIIYYSVGYVDSSSPAVVGSPVCEACATAFGGKGYLGSCGEWGIVLSNKTAINSMLTKIDGLALNRSYYYCSTLYNDNHTWIINWNSGTRAYGDKSTLRYARAFCAL